MTIIVLLILAGVSLNAIIGDNGIITQAMNTNFVAEMTDIQEALDVWKAQYGEDKVPVKELANVSDIIGNGRITGEITYYRIWAFTENIPPASIRLSDEKFNNVYIEELNYIPRGIEDLYYLDTEAIGIHTKYKYIIDAANSMVYSVLGYSTNNTLVHSLAMYRMVLNGDTLGPVFKFAEVKNTGTGKIAAGNTEPEYWTNEKGEWVDKDGKKVDTKEKAKNPNYNPNGFKLIAGTNNVYKLYNNGDLYGKGLKGDYLNTPVCEMEAIDSARFCEWSVEKVIPELSDYKEIIQGAFNIFIIDNNDNLWAYGDNAKNKFGLTTEQQVSYTGRDPVKLDLHGKKPSKVWGQNDNVFVLTQDNCLLVAGKNEDGECGQGHQNLITEFVSVRFSDNDTENNKIISGIEGIYDTQGNDIRAIIIKSNVDTGTVDSNGNPIIEARFYFAGSDCWGIIGNGERNWTPFTTFTRIWNGQNNMGPDMDQDIKELAFTGTAINILKYDGTLWHAGYRGKAGRSWWL